LKCPCYEGEVNVLVMKDPVYPLIIGNNVFQSETIKKVSTPVDVEPQMFTTKT